MFNGKYGNILTVILVIVILLILGLVGWFAYDIYDKNSVDNNAKSALNEFKTVKNKVKDSEKDGDTELNVGNVLSTDKNAGKTKTYLAGYEIKGAIKIPRTGVEYPVLSEVSKKSLEVAVAILYGPGLNEVGNTVILGHNYRNSSFFSNNDKLTEGDIIEITDQAGTTIEYEIYKMYETTEEDAEYMIRDTEGRREISLSTCTDDSSARLVIWAKEK
ncbi:MAG: sortase [Clostridia bacterium]|nr:sortase [Clostridia bacterium]